MSDRDCKDQPWRCFCGGQMCLIDFLFKYIPFCYNTRMDNMQVAWEGYSGGAKGFGIIY